MDNNLYHLVYCLELQCEICDKIQKEMKDISIENNNIEYVNNVIYVDFVRKIRI